jgi:hypothetical protein
MDVTVVARHVPWLTENGTDRWLGIYPGIVTRSIAIGRPIGVFRSVTQRTQLT